jgi:putative RecB family exonuclease
MTFATISPYHEAQEQTGQVWDYVSPSRMSLFFRCPLAFRKRYIDGIVSPTSPSLFIGKVVHSVLAHLYGLRHVGYICNETELPQYIADLWNYTMEAEPCFFVDDAEEEKSRYQVLELLKAYMASTPIQDEMPTAIEKRYEEPLVDPATGEYLGISLVGIVDLVLKDGAGNTIIDFKTSATSSLCALQHETQLTAYAYLFREATGRKESRCEIRQLVKTKTPKIVAHRFPQRTDEHFDRFFGLIREYLDALDRGVYNYRPGVQCSMCEHHGTCCC